MIVIHPDFRAWMRRHQLDGWTELLGLLGTLPASQGNHVVIQRLDLGREEGAPGDVFLKLYRYGSPSWKYLGRHSKAACEFRNYRVFQDLGIPCPQPVAMGEQRDAIGRLRAAFIVTQAVPHAVTLAEFFNRPEMTRRSQAERQRRLDLLARLARQIRHLHHHNFFHNDLVWRNLLVSASAPDSLKLAWIDCPRGGFAPIRLARNRKALRDLGSFDKSASRQCSAGERLHFFKSYFNQGGKLTPDLKRRIRQVLVYWRRRWPEDWPG